MKILKQEKTGNKVKVQIEEDWPIFKAMVEREYDETVQNIAVPGFRKGKVPREVAEQYLNKNAVFEHATQNLVSALYPEIMKQGGLEPVDYPNVVIMNQKEGEPFVFSLEVDVYPLVKLGKYVGIKVEKEPEEVTEAEVLEFLNDLRKRFAKMVEVSGRGIENEDVVEMDLKAIAEDKEIKGLSGRRIALVMGEGQISEVFDKHMMGLNVGEEKQFNVPVPAGHAVREIAGKSVHFTATPRKISRMDLPGVNDEFAKMMSGSDSLESFKKEIAARLQENKKQKAESEVKNRLIEEVTHEISVDIPEGMIRRETDLMIEELEGSLMKDRTTLADYLKATKKTEQDLRGELRVGALARVKAKLALREVGLKEKLAVTEEDLAAEIEALSASSGEKKDKFESTIGEAGLDYIKDYLLRRKALEFIMSKAKISEKHARKKEAKK